MRYELWNGKLYYRKADALPAEELNEDTAINDDAVKKLNWAIRLMYQHMLDDNIITRFINKITRRDLNKLGQSSSKQYH